MPITPMPGSFDDLLASRRWVDYFFASSTEFVGEFWLRKIAKCVI
jgi:hypothetical protein